MVGGLKILHMYILVVKQSFGPKAKAFQGLTQNSLERHDPQRKGSRNSDI
jgi:hypothetical protein